MAGRKKRPWRHMASTVARKDWPMVWRVMLEGKNQAIRGKETHCIRRAVVPMAMTSRSSSRKRAMSWGAKRKPSAASTTAAAAASLKKKK